MKKMGAKCPKKLVKIKMLNKCSFVDLSWTWYRWKRGWPTEQWRCRKRIWGQLQSSANISIQRNRLSISIFIYIKFSNSMDTYKHGNKEKLLINSFFLFTFKLVIWKSLSEIKTLIEKSHFILFQNNLSLKIQ